MTKNVTLLIIFALFSFSSKNRKIKVPKGFAHIPYDIKNTNENKTSSSLIYMFDHEVTNKEYRNFLKDLKTKDTQKYTGAILDTLAWNKSGDALEPMANMYAWHPAFDNYPVVNVSKKGAELYCKWLNTKLKNEYGSYIQQVRLPTKKEWTFAAKGGLEKAIYPWGGPYLRNHKGCYLANFYATEKTFKPNDRLKQVSDSTYFLNNAAADGALLTAITKSYDPNGYGLYNMSGNVAELCAENIAMGGHWKSDGNNVRVTSEIPFEKANSYVGFRPVIDLFFSELEKK